MTCPDCGARNPDTAEWCGQCLASLRRPADAPQADTATTASEDVQEPTGGVPPPVPDVVDPSAPLFDAPADPVSAPSAEPSGDASDGPSDRGFRTVDGEVEWRCRQCEQWNPLLLPTCACGAHLGQAEGEPDPSTVRARMARTRRFLWGAAILLGAFAVIGVLIVVIVAQSAG